MRRTGKEEEHNIRELTDEMRRCGGRRKSTLGEVTKGNKTGLHMNGAEGEGREKSERGREARRGEHVYLQKAKRIGS